MVVILGRLSCLCTAFRQCLSIPLFLPHDIVCSHAMLMAVNVQDQEDMILAAGARPVSLGPVSLLGSHCITLTHHYLDR